ncbi:hypothetical protein [Ferruginibacter sp.]
MRIFVLLVFLLPLAAAAQSKTDYKNAMAKFQKFYNAGRGDSINAMFGHGWDEMKSTKALWTNEDITTYLGKYGQIKSFRFIGIDDTDPNKVYVFETIFSKGGAKTTSLTLDKEYALDTFRFITTSDRIEELVKQNKKGR